MRGIIVYNRADYNRNKSYISRYINYFSERGIELRLVFDTDINNNIVADFAIVRTINPNLTRLLEARGIKCFNNYNVSNITNDKLMCYKYVSQNNIEIMPFYENIEAIDAYPVVMKPKDGHGGDRVIMCRNKEDIYNNLHIYEKDNYVIQKMATDIGKDVRVYVIGKEIVVAMLRQSQKDFRSNFCLGGSASKYNLSDDEIKIVNKIIDLFDFDFVGIDFIFNNGKIVFNEIEDVVGSRMVYTQTDINIVRLYVDYIIKNLGM